MKTIALMRIVGSTIPLSMLKSLAQFTKACWSFIHILIFKLNRLASSYRKKAASAARPARTTLRPN
jgi:hypothetical protein